MNSSKTNETMDLKEQYNHIIESIPLGYTLNQVLVDEDGNPSDIIILEANSQFEQNMGIKKMDIVEKSIKSILPDADDEMIRKYGRVALTGEPLEMEYYSKTLQKYFKVKVTSPAKNYLISYFTDITEYKNQPDGSYEKIAEYHSFSERSKSLNEQTQSANEELEKKKNLFQSLFDVSTSIKLIIEFDSGRIVNANKAAMDFYKYTFEEITNLNINQINTLTDEQIRHEMELAKENRRNYFNFKHRLKNGEIRDVEVYSDKVIIDDKIHLYSIIHDITERKLLEKEVKEYTKKLAESELKFRQMYENTSIGIAVVSLDFTLRAANAAYCQMLGYDEKELIGKTIRDITHPEILDKNLELQTQLILGEIDSYQLEKKFIHKDGHTVFGLLNATIIRNTNGEPLYFLGNVQDITERKMMEFELIETKEKAEKNEQKYKNLFTNMMNGFGIHEMIFNENGEPIDYVFLEVNPAWEKLVNAKADLVIGKRIKEFMPYIEPSWIERYGKIVKTGIPEEFTDYNEATKKYYNVFAYKLDGNKFATVFNDVTDKKQFETDLIRAKEKAEESDRLKSAFLQNMSHEIRTPLNAIFGFAGILNKPDLSDEKRKSFVSIIQNSSHQLLDIINNIITLASLETKQERIHIDKVCINNIIVDLH
ncbi:MAG TPA: PAS domain S-box protein, partial [Salinivirgaceae bacterium]|nr:PAS domain S-box protein [Salinivirgaceae bacterium]